MLRKGDKGPEVKLLQERLLALGYALPRFGADSFLGGETFEALNSFLAGHKAEPGVALDLAVSPEELALVSRVYHARQAAPPSPEGYEDHTSKHPMPKPEHCKHRGWKKTTGVCLHQTATVLGENPARYYGVAVHFAITRLGKIIHLNPIDWNLPAANALNSDTVSIEIDGHFAGVEGLLRTYWRPKETPNRQPLTITDAQIKAARTLLTWLKAEVASHDGALTEIRAHRQGADDRDSDPGSRVWQEVGLWSMEYLALSDGGHGWTRGKGKPLPEAWGKGLEYKGIAY